MAMDAERTMALAGGILAIAFMLALFRPMVVSFYVPALQDWEYMREVSLRVDHVGVPVLLSLDLPSDSNFWSHVSSDCSDVRVTIGRGGSEHLLKSQVVSCDPQSKEGRVFVLLEPPSEAFTLRLYYGNPDAEQLDYGFGMGYIYKAPPFDESDYSIVLSDDATPWGVLSFHGHSKVYLLKYGEGDGVLTLGTAIPEGARVEFEVESPGWGNGYVFVPLADGNFSPVDLSGSVPSDGILMYTDGKGRIFVDVYRSGQVVYSTSVKHEVEVKMYFGDGSVYVYIGKVLAVKVGYFRRISFLVSSGGGEKFVLEKLRVKYNVEHPEDVVYSAELLSPRSPRLDILSPSDGGYYPGVVPVSFTVSDPNGDLNSVVVELDGNVIFSGYAESYSDELNLPDGSYTIAVTAVDSEGISVSEEISFVVDTVPPDVNVDASYEHPVLHLELNVYDSSPVTCSVMLPDGNVLDFNCAAVDLNVDYSASVVLRVQDAAGNFVEHTITTPPKPSPPTSGGGFAAPGGGGSQVEVTIKTGVAPRSPAALSAVSVSAYSVIGLFFILLVLLGVVLRFI